MKSTLPIIVLLWIVPAALQAENWPCFRGPSRQGISSEKGLPTTWSGTEHVAWKTPIPGKGWSSPIVWGNQVFVTTAQDNGTDCQVICLDTKDGQVRWARSVFKQTAGHKQERNSEATPTPCTDGERVYAVFGDGSFAALNLQGEVAWTNRNFPFYGEHGLGTSAILWKQLLIMTRDGSGRPPDTGAGWHTAWDQASILALDAVTGQLRWQAKRGLSRIAHVVPNIWTANDGHSELVSGAGDVVQGFDLSTGERLWSSKNIGEGVVPSIVLGEDLAFTACGWGGRESIKAFRLGQRGELGEANLVWEQRKGMSRVASYLYLKPYLYTVTDGGIVQCLKESTGEIVWQERISGAHSASPVAGEGHIYFLSDDGETTILEAGPTFKILAKNPLHEKCQASMAVSQGRLFIRTSNALYCIGK